MYYLAQSPSVAGAAEPLIRHSFTLPALSKFTADVK